MILALLWGCGPQCSEDEVVTREGCVPAAESVGWDEETLPGYRLRACRTLEPGEGTLDFEDGCASGACLGDTYGSFRAALGEPTEIEGAGSWVLVDWDQRGLYAYFDDDDGDNEPDPDEPVYRFVVNGPAAGTSVDGLATELSLACFVQVLGPPDDVDTVDGMVETLRYDALALRIHDFSGAQTFLDPDGYVDVISFDSRP